MGAGIFRNARCVYLLQKMRRFKGPVLVRILDTMRTLGGEALRPSDWQALLGTELEANSCSAKTPTELDGWCHGCDD